MACAATHRAPLTELAHVCWQCGAEAKWICGNRVCGAQYCSVECQRLHWTSGHGTVCKALLQWIPGRDYDTTAEPVEGIVDFLRGKSAKSEDDPNALQRLVSRYDVPEDKSSGVFTKLSTLLKNKDTAAADDDGTEKRLLDSTDDVKRLRASKKTADATESAEETWKRKSGGAMTEVLHQMRDITKQAKDRKLDTVKPLESMNGPLSSTDLVKRFMTKVAIAGFKVGFASAKVAAGSGAETATVVGIPLDTLIDAIAVALDVMIFAATVMESIYGIIRSFVEIKDHLVMLLTFSGGPPGVQAAVDALMGVLAKLGLKGRAEQFMGSIVELFERFIRWVAPVIGSVIGLAIPYDASITGRVIEFFLYPVRFFISEGWLLISKTWDLLPESWQAILSSRERWNELLVAFVDMIKRLFPSGDGDTWKSRLIDKAKHAGIKIFNVHPLVVVGVISRERVDKSLSNVFDTSKKVSNYVDRTVSSWIDNLVIPNIDKISVLVQAALGLGFGFIYMLHAYTPDGTRKKLGIAAPLDSPTTAVHIALHLSTDATARDRFVLDPEARQREMLSILSQPQPTLNEMQFLAVCSQLGLRVRV